MEVHIFRPARSRKRWSTNEPREHRRTGVADGKRREIRQ